MTLDFSLFEKNIAKNLINERWSGVDIKLADVEVSRTSSSKSLPYPALVWETSKCTFVVIKVDELPNRMRLVEARCSEGRWSGAVENDVLTDGRLGENDTGVDLPQS